MLKSKVNGEVRSSESVQEPLMSYAVLFIDAWPRRIRDTLKVHQKCLSRSHILPNLSWWIDFKPQDNTTNTTRPENVFIHGGVSVSIFQSGDTDVCDVYTSWNVNGKLSIMSRKAAIGLFDPGHHSVEIDWHLLFSTKAKQLILPRTSRPTHDLM